MVRSASQHSEFSIITDIGSVLGGGNHYKSQGLEGLFDSVASFYKHALFLDKGVIF